MFKFSEDKVRELKTLKKHYILNQKAYIQNTFDSKFEEEVNIYIDGMPDIISCIKIGYITIPYLDSIGIWKIISLIFLLSN